MTKELRKEIGKFFVDIAKLVIGGTVLSSILRIEGVQIKSVMIIGGLTAIIVAVIGFAIMNIKEK